MAISIRFITGPRVLGAKEAERWLASSGISLGQYPEFLQKSLGWYLQNSAKTYGFLQQTEFMSDFLAASSRPRSIAPAIIIHNAVYCPGIDDEMKANIGGLILGFKGMYGQAFEGGRGGLRSLSPKSTLYILAHGHLEMPVCETDKGKWTAWQMAEMLKDDGLRKDHRVIELLMCHAGESVSSAKASDKRLDLMGYLATAKATGNVAAQAQINKAYDKVKGPAPAPYTKKSQELPFAALFIQAMKNLKYTHLRVISYACPVAMVYSFGKVTLDLKNYGGKEMEPFDAAKHAKYKQVWL